MFKSFMRNPDVRFCCSLFGIATILILISAISSWANGGVTHNFKLELEQHGTYDWTGQNIDDCFVYRFDSPNADICVYKEGDSIYLVGEDSLKGISYGTKFVANAQFIGLSDKYLLFLNEWGLIAISFEEKKDAKVGESCYIYFSPDELSNKEKAAFIYPVSYGKMKEKF